MTYEIRLIGGGRVGHHLVDRLEYRGDTVVVIEQDEKRARTLAEAGYRVHHGDGTDVETLDEVDADAADVVVVATGDDDTNLLAAQLVRNRFDPDSVVARVNRPENEAPFRELGIDTVSRTDATARMLDLQIESPAMTRWMESIGHEGDVQEIAVENPALAGSTVHELDERLPDQVLLVMVGDEGNAHLPADDEVLERGDHVTVVGTRPAVREAMRLLGGDDRVGSDDAPSGDRSEPAR